MTERNFYRTVIHVEVLSEEPYVFDGNLVDVANDISSGDCSGVARTIQEEKCNGARIAQLLIAQGSDPEFFGVDENGNDTI
jgi:hypothetical protein